MSNRTLGNYLHAHRKKSGLSQLELARLLGYRRKYQVSRHEISRTAPPLLIALAYEQIFQVPVSAIFTGMQATVAQVIEKNLAELEKDLRGRLAKGRTENRTSHKLQWLMERRTLA